MTLYDDFPGCLPRYAWLVVDAERAGAGRLFHGVGDCKACGDRVGVDARGQREHVRLHRRQLQQSARQREREAAKRLREVNRLRAESRARS